jgi:hypothetical protein
MSFLRNHLDADRLESLLGSISSAAAQRVIAEATIFRSRCDRTRTFKSAQEAEDFDAGFHAYYEGGRATDAQKWGFLAAEKREGNRRDERDAQREGEEA